MFPPIVVCVSVVSVVAADQVFPASQVLAGKRCESCPASRRRRICCQFNALRQHANCAAAVARRVTVGRAGRAVDSHHHLFHQPDTLRPLAQGRYLGDGYRVEASVGHVRDLLRSQLSVDVDNDFTPKYRVPNEKRAVVKELKK